MSEVRLQDTLTGEKRALVPLRDDGIGVYSCGPTVYGPAHIGNFRSFLFADLLVRHLRWRGHTVRWVMNITDVDDKIIRGAAAAGIGIDELANRYLEGFLADADALRMTRPDVLPRATEHIDEMVALIGTLLEREHAYRTDDGSIFFRIASWPTYGRLARLDPEQLRVGERVEADEYAKDDVRDFALWKGAQTGRAVVEDRHRRRSARLAHRMLRHEHGPPRDVVRYPHRRHRPDLPAPRGRDRPERRRDRPAIRQHLAALRAPAVERHEDGQVDGEHRPAERAVRGGRVASGAALCAPRRALPGGLNHSDKSLAAAAAALSRLDALVAALAAYREDRSDDDTLPALLADAREAFGAALDDDLNISEALAATFDLLRDLNRRIEARSISTDDAARALELMRDLDLVLGVLPDADEGMSPELRSMLDERAAARAARDWAASDRLRDELLAQGIAVEDTRDGQRWRRLVEVGRWLIDRADDRRRGSGWRPADRGQGGPGGPRRDGPRSGPRRDGPGQGGPSFGPRRDGPPADGPGPLAVRRPSRWTAPRRPRAHRSRIGRPGPFERGWPGRAGRRIGRGLRARVTRVVRAVRGQVAGPGTAIGAW